MKNVSINNEIYTSTCIRQCLDMVNHLVRKKNIYIFFSFLVVITPCILSYFKNQFKNNNCFYFCRIKSTRVWLGTHSMMGSPSNWNNDRYFVKSLSPRPFSEKCVVIGPNLIQSWLPCNTNSFALTEAVCVKYGLGKTI